MTSPHCEPRWNLNELPAGISPVTSYSLSHLSVLKPQWNNRGPLSWVKLSHSNAEYSSAESSQSAFCRGSSWLLLKSKKIISSSVSLVLLPHWYSCFYSSVTSPLLIFGWWGYWWVRKRSLLFCFPYLHKIRVYGKCHMTFHHTSCIQYTVQMTSTGCCIYCWSYITQIHTYELSKFYWTH